MQVEKSTEVHFSDNLSQLLTGKGLKQKELAAKLGVAEATVSKWFRKGAIPQAEVMHKLELLFGVSSHFLLTGRHPSGKRFIDRLLEEQKEANIEIEVARLKKIQSDLDAVAKNLTKIAQTRSTD